MNPRTKKINRRPCVVCGYPYSDRHHLYPEKDGGKHTINLCPNHHRFANILQLVAINSGDDGFNAAKAFALKNFDKEFNEKVLDLLINTHAMGVFYVGLLGAVGEI